MPRKREIIKVLAKESKGKVHVGITDVAVASHGIENFYIIIEKDS